MKRKWLICLLCLLLAVLFSACNGDSNAPPDPGTPEPAPLSGTYYSPEGVLIFNGDGESVRLEDISSLLADATGLPMGESEGTYAFTFHGGLWRYDVAETLSITVGEQTCKLTNMPGETGESVVAVVSPLQKGKSLRFVRQDG